MKEIHLRAIIKEFGLKRAPYITIYPQLQFGDDLNGFGLSYLISWNNLKSSILTDNKFSDMSYVTMIDLAAAGFNVAGLAGTHLKKEELRNDCSCEVCEE